MSVHCLESGCIENTPTSALEISLGRGFCTPRPSRLPSGNLSGLGAQNLSGLGVQNPRSWEICWASVGVFSNTSLLSAVYGFKTTDQCHSHSGQLLYSMFILHLRHIVVFMKNFNFLVGTTIVTCCILSLQCNDTDHID